jgi:hypothetical protein
MTAIDKLIQILELHSQLLVEDVYSRGGLLGSEWIDASEWDKQQCLDFLGY